MGTDWVLSIDEKESDAPWLFREGEPDLPEGVACLGLGKGFLLQISLALK